MNPKLIFLYPQEDIIDFEVGKGSVFYERGKIGNYLSEKYLPRINVAENEKKREIIQAEARDELKKLFTPVYSQKLASCIHQRYRKNNFDIFYALLDNTEISPLIKLYPKDKIIYVGMDTKTHRTKMPDGKFPYPNEDYILNQLMPLDKLVVAGFHLWDCVQRIAERAYKRGIDTIVDEDLTEQFSWIFLTHSNFRIKKQNSFNPKLDKYFLEDYIRARKDKPWMRQII